MAEDSTPQIRPKLETILYGASYYHEYIPCERLVQYTALMKDARMSGMNAASMPFDAKRMFWGGFKPFVEA